MFLRTDIGANNKKNRELWLEKTLRKIPAGLRILDVGAGEQQYKKFCLHLKYTSQDFAKYDGKGNRKGKQTDKWNYGKLDIVSDITKIPRPDKSFDAVMCVEVLEHVPDPIAAVRELSRLLKKGGYLILTAPVCSLTHFAPYHFYSGFDKYFYEKFLPENNLKIISINPNGNYFEYLAQEMQRLMLVANTYVKPKPDLLTQLLNRMVNGVYLLLLARFSILDTGSSELLCFGDHVLAKKTT